MESYCDTTLQGRYGVTAPASQASGLPDCLSSQDLNGLSSPNSEGEAVTVRSPCMSISILMRQFNNFEGFTAFIMFSSSISCGLLAQLLKGKLCS